MMIWDEETKGRRIKRLREKLGMSQRDLGAAVDLSEDTISRIETDATLAAGEFGKAIAKVLGVSELYLQHGDTHAERQTRRLIQSMKPSRGITDAEEVKLTLLSCDAIQYRNNLRVPLSEADLEGLLAVIRGGDHAWR